MKTLSKAAFRLKGQKMFQILAQAKDLERQGRTILHFELGDPDFDTPDNIKRSAVQAIDEGYTHYAPSSGLRELKEAAADVTVRSRGFRPDLDQLLVCPGANAIIYYAAVCALDPGDEVIVSDPGFVSYYSILDFIGAKIVRMPLYEHNHFRLSPDDVRKAITSKTRMIIMNSPANPTGAVMTANEVKALYKIAQEADVYLLSDEIYARMIYERDEVEYISPSQFDHCRERTIIVNGFSKSYAMTGWRLGVGTGPKEIIQKMALALETEISCVSPFIQKAGVEALRGDQGQIYDMIAAYKERRDVLVEGLNRLPGVSCLKPGGAFYVFPNIKGTGLSSEEFTKRMLNEVGVAVVPGHIFGAYGEGYIRLSYANSLDNIHRALDAMGSCLKSHMSSV